VLASETGRISNLDPQTANDGKIFLEEDFASFFILQLKVRVRETTVSAQYEVDGQSSQPLLHLCALHC
jgi:hypothetical protein